MRRSTLVGLSLVVLAPVALFHLAYGDSPGSCGSDGHDTVELCGVAFATAPPPPTATGSGPTPTPVPSPVPVAPVASGMPVGTKPGSVGTAGGGTTGGGTTGGGGATSTANGWQPGNGLATASAGHPLLATSVAGRPFTATFSVQSADFTTGFAGAPIAGGQLAVDLLWAFGTGNGGRIYATQSAVISITIVPGVFNYKVVNFHGVVPPIPGPGYPTGFTPTVLLDVTAESSPGGTTAFGNSDNMLDIRIER